MEISAENRETLFIDSHQKIFFVSHIMTKQNRRTLGGGGRETVKADEKSKRDPCNLDVMYF